jgi:protein-disulfide isomerase
MWLGIGFFGVAGIALLISLSSIFNDNSAESGVEVSDPVVAAPPASLEEHQQLVSEVVEDLDRDILIGDSPTLGNPDADIVLLKFSDYECPYCAQATTQVETFMADHEADVLFVYKHLPLTRIHSEALPAALAAWAADQQDQFWAYHHELFRQQADLSEDVYVQIAEDLGLDLDQFNRDRASEAAKAAIARDLALAAEFQLTSTPTFIMDNMLIPGAVPAEFFTEALARLQAARTGGS